jgi:hypothetical protein
MPGTVTAPFVARHPLRPPQGDERASARGRLRPGAFLCYRAFLHAVCLATAALFPTERRWSPPSETP